jgi:hypothetical protein
MTIRNHINPAFGPRQFVRITTVRTDTRKIEAQLKDGGNIQISLFDVPSFFVWPKEGEYWIVRQDGGYWKLDNKFDNADDTKVIHLAPGEAKVAAEVIKTPTGKSIIIVDDSKATSGQVIGYQDGVWGPIDQTGGTGGTSTGTANTIRYGSGVPSSSTGSNGDFYIDTSVNYIYGPKASGSWPSGTSLIGPQGSTGATGATGAAGAAGVIQSISPTSGSPITVVGGTTANPTIGITKGGTTSGDIVTIDGSQTLTNKTIGVGQLSGQVAITNGGTGAATAAINTVFAGPGSGSTGAPLFRSLVAGDLPNAGVTQINGANITTGSTGNTITADANTLTNTTLKSTVVNSSLTSLGTQAQALNMGTQKITNVTDPTAAQDAATKNYVDRFNNNRTSSFFCSGRTPEFFYWSTITPSPGFTYYSKFTPFQNITLTGTSTVTLYNTVSSNSTYNGVVRIYDSSGNYIVASDFVTTVSTGTITMSGGAGLKTAVFNLTGGKTASLSAGAVHWIGYYTPSGAGGTAPTFYASSYPGGQQWMGTGLALSATDFYAASASAGATPASIIGASSALGPLIMITP